jgi:lambda family phage portal protein
MGIVNAWNALWEPNPKAIKPQKKRAFAGAEVSRLTAGWNTSVQSADSEIKGSLKKLRNRSRQLTRDVDYCRNAIRAITDNVVGTGVRLQVQVRKQRASKGGKLDQKLNDQIERAWKKWGHANSCDVAGKLCFDDFTRQAVSAWAESGECLIRLIRGKQFGDSEVPFALQLLESDMLDEDYQGKAQKKGWEWRMGVLCDQWGRPQKYAFFSRHPGDTLFVNQPTAQERHIFVDAKDVIHLAKFERPGQTRGVPWMASAIQRMHHLEGYEQAEIVRARASSALMAWIQSPEGELEGDGITDDERVFDMSPGAIRYLSPGETVHVPNLDAPDGQFEPFLRAMLRALAAGIGCSYETISRDYSQTNYSSSRLSLLQDQEAFKALQYQLKEVFLERVYKEWLELAVLAGALELPTYQAEPNRFRMAKWLFRGWGWVDPMKEVQSAQLAVKSGFKTQSQILAETSGMDLEEFLVARKNEIDLAEQLGLKFDIDVSATPTQAVSKVDETFKPEEDDGEQT